MNKQKVFVGLSGGVDSSVAALRLKQSGFNVVGVFIKVWHPDFLVCNWEQERLDAMRVAAHLDIPFLTCDAEESYRDDVAKYFITEYEKGRTPNPDVMCNQYVKFGAFINFAKENGANFIATGHYVQKIKTGEDEQMYRGIDQNKDQSYFLWSLTKEQLQFSLFPVGDTNKELIRQEAVKAGLPTATKKDSQGVCFLGQIDIGNFLAHYIDIKPGLVLDETGKVIGEHHGAFIYTIGQRHGFTINLNSNARSPYFVISKDITANTITVSTEKPILVLTDRILLTRSLFRRELIKGNTYQAQTRYRQKPFSVRVETTAFDQTTLTVLEKTDALAEGQSCVLYEGDCCLGGGIIA